MALSQLRVGEPLAHLPRVLARQAPRGTKIMVVTDSAVRQVGQSLVRQLHRSGFEAVLTEVASGERSKTLQTAERLYRRLAMLKFERGSWLVALGGGVVGDLTGFVASSYLRGIAYVQVPTTLLAQVDASIGGKTGVDIPEGKNLVGAFYHPRLIWIDPTLLKTLPKRHWQNGLAEVIKYGAIRDAKLFELLERKINRLVKGFHPDWTAIIARCAKIKTDVVDRDPKETKGLRAILNFGHSVGHAVEAASGYKDYLHGEAISIGMFIAGALSEELCDLKPVDRIRLNSLLTQAGLPWRVKRPISRARLMAYLARDKKVQQGTMRFVLLKRLGQAVSGCAVPPQALDRALRASGL